MIFPARLVPQLSPGIGEAEHRLAAKESGPKALRSRMQSVPGRSALGYQGADPVHTHNH